MLGCTQPDKINKSPNSGTGTTSATLENVVLRTRQRKMTGAALLTATLLVLLAMKRAGALTDT
jgi:hypothetical protein